MMMQAEKTDGLLALIREGKPMTLGQQLRLTVRLSIPAVIAQLSSIVMQYIDAAMVGSLGAEASASIGLVSTTTWLFWGLCVAAAMGFSVQVAPKIGAGDMQGARAVLRQHECAEPGRCGDVRIGCCPEFLSDFSFTHMECGGHLFHDAGGRIKSRLCGIGYCHWPLCSLRYWD